METLEDIERRMAQADRLNPRPRRTLPRILLPGACLLIGISIGASTFSGTTIPHPASLPTPPPAKSPEKPTPPTTPAPYSPPDYGWKRSKACSNTANYRLAAGVGNARFEGNESFGSVLLERLCAQHTSLSIPEKIEIAGAYQEHVPMLTSDELAEAVFQASARETSVEGTHLSQAQLVTLARMAACTYHLWLKDPRVTIDHRFQIAARLMNERRKLEKIEEFADAMRTVRDSGYRYGPPLASEWCAFDDALVDLLIYHTGIFGDPERFTVDAGMALGAWRCGRRPQDVPDLTPDAHLIWTNGAAGGWTLPPSAQFPPPTPSP